MKSSRSRLSLTTGLFGAVERFTDEEPDSQLGAFALGQFDFYTWERLTTTISAEASAQPILTQWGRVRLNMTFKIKKEIISNFTVSLFVTEHFDSQPTSETANKNDFSLTSTVGLIF